MWRRQKVGNQNNSKFAGNNNFLKKRGLAELNIDRLRCPANGTGDESLLTVVSSGTFQDVERVLGNEKEECSQEAVDHALFEASRRGHKLSVLLLLNAGARPIWKDAAGNTALMVCAQNGFLEIARLLLDKGAEANAVNNIGELPISLSIRENGSIDMVKLFTREFFPSYIRIGRGQTLLQKAILLGDIYVIKLLADKGTLNSLEQDVEMAHCLAKERGLGEFLQLLADKRTSTEPLIIQAVQMRNLKLLDMVFAVDYKCAEKVGSRNETALYAFLETLLGRSRSFSSEDKEIIKLLLKKGIDVNHRAREVRDGHQRQDSLLQMGVRPSHQIPELLLQMGVRPSHQIPESPLQMGVRPSHQIPESPLQMGVRLGDVETVDLFLKCGAKVNWFNEEEHYSPLMLAAKDGHGDIVDCLFRWRAPLDARSIHGTALEVAFKHGQELCARRILEEYAKTNVSNALKLAIENHQLNSMKFLVEKFGIKKQDAGLMECAIETGDVDVVIFLFNMGFDLNAVMYSYFRSVIRYYTAGDIRTGKIDRLSPTLHIAIRYRQSKIVECLLKSGACVNSVDSYGTTPLSLAAQEENPEIVRLLLEHGANVNRTSEQGKSPLLIAAECNRYENVALLLSAAADVNVQDDSGKTPLMMAGENGNRRIALMLLEHNPDVNMADCDGRTCLMFWTTFLAFHTNSDTTILQLLISKGADLNRVDHSGNTALMLASHMYTRSSPIVIEHLINSGADVNISNHENETPLSISLAANMMKSVRLLLTHGAFYTSGTKNRDAVHLMVDSHLDDLIPLAMGKGFYPRLLNFNECIRWKYVELFALFSFESLSPMCLAIAQGKFGVAEYLMKYRFLTKFDIAELTETNKFRERVIERLGCSVAEKYDKIVPPVFSLLTISFVQVLEMLGEEPGREDRVNALPLPVPLRQRLLFRWMV